MASWGAADLPEWYRRGRRSAMPLNLDTMHCAARIIGDRRRQAGAAERGAVGTGFFVTVASERFADARWPYLVTAHHVIALQSNVEVQVPNPVFDGWLSRPVAVPDWRQPLEGVDLAVAPIAPGPFPSHLAIRLEDQVLAATQPRPLFPGSIVYYVGLLAPDDRVMARSGTIGALDQTRLSFPQGYSYPAHLVDCRSYGGFSGSPCFVDHAYAELKPVEPPSPLPPDSGPVGELMHHTLLCGMFTAHRTDENDDGTVSRYGVGVMLRSEEIREALMSDELRRQRAEGDEALAAEKDAADPGFELADVGSDFERFEDLTRRLVKVPKAEVDERRRKSDQSGERPAGA